MAGSLELGPGLSDFGPAAMAPLVRPARVEAGLAGLDALARAADGDDAEKCEPPAGVCDVSARKGNLSLIQAAQGGMHGGDTW